jgi:SPW repeat
MKFKHWQDVVNAVLGAWVIASPWILGFAANEFAMVGSIVLGVALLAVAFGAILVPGAWEEWAETLLGMMAIVAPWVLGFSAEQTPRLGMVATGIVIAGLALWTLTTDPDYGFGAEPAAH